MKNTLQRYSLFLNLQVLAKIKSVVLTLFDSSPMFLTKKARVLRAFCIVDIAFYTFCNVLMCCVLFNV